MSNLITTESATAEATDLKQPASFPKLLVYLTVLIGLPAAFLLSSIVIVRSSSFPVVAADPFLLNLDYPFNLRNVNCDIVIYGDSTAITGLDPTVIEKSTNLKTCNIAQSQSILEIAGPLALNDYLKNNKPPKFLIIQLSPETLSRDQKSLFWPEGLTVLVRRRPLPYALFYMLRHPVQSYNFALWAIKAKAAALRHRTPDFSQTEAGFVAHRGLLTLPKPPETSCSRKNPIFAHESAYVDKLRHDYSKHGTRVLIEISPIPDCSPNAQVTVASMKGVTDNELPLYPIHLFCDLDRHLTLQGAEKASSDLAGQILAMAKPLHSSQPGELTLRPRQP